VVANSSLCRLRSYLQSLESSNICQSFRNSIATSKNKPCHMGVLNCEPCFCPSPTMPGDTYPLLTLIQYILMPIPHTQPSRLDYINTAFIIEHITLILFAHLRKYCMYLCYVPLCGRVTFAPHGRGGSHAPLFGSTFSTARRQMRRGGVSLPAWRNLPCCWVCVALVSFLVFDFNNILYIIVDNSCLQTYQH
jgi:hypothetical protein